MSGPVPGGEVVEQALALSRADGCLVVVEESSTANLRWAGSTLTTNGAVRGRSVTVISVVGESVGVRGASVVDDLEALVRASESAARDAGPAEDAGPLVTGDADPGFDAAGETVSPGVFADLARELGAAFAERDRALYGYASHDLTTTWLGSSTGLRRRHVQPRGYVELTGKSDGGSSWVGRHTRDWADVSVARPGRRAAPAARLGQAAARAAGRPLRDAAAAVDGGRPDGLRVLDDGGPQRRRGPHGLQPPRRRDARRRAASGRRGCGCGATRTTRRSRRRRSWSPPARRR